MSRSKTVVVGMRALVASKLVQRTFEVEGNKRTAVEIQVTTWARTSSSSRPK